MNNHKDKLAIIICKITSGNDSLEPPRNFIMKWRAVGNPKPNEYTINTPYLTN